MTNSTTSCQSVVGVWNPETINNFTLASCGWAIATRRFVGNDQGMVNLSPYQTRVGVDLLSDTITDFPAIGGYYIRRSFRQAYLSSVFNNASYAMNTAGTDMIIYSTPGMVNSYSGINGDIQNVFLYGNQTLSAYQEAVHAFRPQANFTGSIANYYGKRGNIAGTTGTQCTITNYYMNLAPTPTLLTITNMRAHRCDGTGLATGINTCHSSTERTGATFNAAFHIDSNAATDGASYCAGTSFDVCMGRKAANVWGLKTGNSLQVPGWLSLGGVTYGTALNGDAFLRRLIVNSRGDTDLYAGSIKTDVGITVQNVGGTQSIDGDIVTNTQYDFTNVGAANTSAMFLDSFMANINITSSSSTPLQLGTMRRQQTFTRFWGPIGIQSLQSQHILRFEANHTGSFNFLNGPSYLLSPQVGCSVSISTYSPFVDGLVRNANATQLSITNYLPHRCSGNGAGTTLNTCFSSAEMTGGTINAFMHANTNAATDGASFCGGTTADACIGRKAAAVMGLKTGNSFQLDGGGVANVAVYAIGGNLKLGTAVGTARTTTATTGYPMLPAVAGTPTGVPQNETINSAAITYDSTGKRLWIRDQPTNAWLQIPTVGASGGTPTCTVLGPAGVGATCTVTGDDRGFVALLNTGTGVTSGSTSLRIDYSVPYPSRRYGISSSVASGTSVTELLTTSPCWTVGPGDANGFWMFNSCLLADSKTYERTFTIAV